MDQYLRIIKTLPILFYFHSDHIFDHHWFKDYKYTNK